MINSAETMNSTGTECGLSTRFFTWLRRQQSASPRIAPAPDSFHVVPGAVPRFQLLCKRTLSLEPPTDCTKPLDPVLYVRPVCLDLFGIDAVIEVVRCGMLMPHKGPCTIR